ncbi:nucleoside triphosphate pyrophosphohydrolase [Halobaculum limi]|uniref:nucleoside triphosphate pyrophosphohydrolase n=1 Tax=Halobaculum limi TaxID=3031916 RepID=UPI002406EBC3|nr:nucleoside triphosphate pyrophosphohydrolase [Halobaculum sp. YSMS11]
MAGDDATTEYDKLVRDDIPAVICESGEMPVTRVVDGEELQRYLLQKLVEEAEEARAAREDPAESVDAELADCVAVLDALLDCRDRERVGRLRREKAADRGAFDDGVVLERVDPDA